MTCKSIFKSLIIAALFALVVWASISITFSLGADMHTFNSVDNEFQNGDISAVLHETL